MEWRILDNQRRDGDHCCAKSSKIGMKEGVHDPTAYRNWCVLKFDTTMKTKMFTVVNYVEVVVFKVIQSKENWFEEFILTSVGSLNRFFTTGDFEWNPKVLLFLGF